MTALPLFWGEGTPKDILNGADQRAEIIRRLGGDRKIIPLDRVERSDLKEISLLLLAQPRLLTGQELVALDAWVRAGGRALIFADPLLSWPSAFPFGDARRPPLSSLLDPLLSHWGLVLKAAPSPTEISKVEVSGLPIAVLSPGAWLSKNSSCILGSEDVVAECAIGKGKVVLVADADLLDARLWAESGIANGEAVLHLINRLEAK